VLRLAEEIAMLDLMSGGSVISGFVRDIGIEPILDEPRTGV